MSAVRNRPALLVLLLTTVCLPARWTVAMSADWDASRVKGALSCQECHKSEYAAWGKSMHATNYRRIAGDAGQEYIKKMGSDESCKKCHSTPHGSDAKFDPSGLTGVGVSCESCHNPAGGAEGWFDLHSNRGGKDISVADEDSDHRSERLRKCDAAGMIRSDNLLALASNCYSCHVVSDEKLLAAGHKQGQKDFDLIQWLQGEVRHNFQTDQQTNAESPSLLQARSSVTADEHKRVLLAVGKIAELQTCLEYLSTSKDPKKKWAGKRGGWSYRADDALDDLKEMQKEAQAKELV